MESQNEEPKSEETIEEAQLDAEAFLYAPIKKTALIWPFVNEKHKFNWFTRPAALKTAERLFDNIEGDELSPEDQFKLYQCIAKSKPKLISLEKEMLSIFRKRFHQYFPYEADLEISRYHDCINALLKAGAIANGVTFNEVLKKNPEALYETIDKIDFNFQHNEKKEMLKWLSHVEDPNAVNMALQYLYDTNESYGDETKHITPKRTQILGKINPDLLYDSDKSTVLTALDTLGTVYRPISDLSPEFILKVLTAKDPFNLIAQDLFNNPHRVKKVYNGLAREYWTIENLDFMLASNNGLLLSEEAEIRLWSRIPTGQIKGFDALFRQKTGFETHEDFMNSLEYSLGEKTENRINSDISSAIKKYESKRWFWERWFSKLPDPILKAKEILNSGTGYYKNLSNSQQFELLQCLNEASKKDKRATKVLDHYEQVLKMIYKPSAKEDFKRSINALDHLKRSLPIIPHVEAEYNSIDMVLTMVKEGIIDTPEKFNVATHKAKHWIFRCYEEFKNNNVNKEISDDAWHLIFKHDNPEEIANAVYLLAQRNASSFLNHNILENSAAPAIIAKASIVLHDQQQRMGDEEKSLDQQMIELTDTFTELAQKSNLSPEIERKEPNIDLIRDVATARKVLKISDALKDQKESKRLFSYLMSIEDSNQLEKLIHNPQTLILIDAMIEAKVYKEPPLHLFGPNLSSDDFFRNIQKDQNKFSEISKACNFELTEEDFRYLFRREHAILLKEEAINSFWKNIPEKTRSRQNFFYITDRASAQYGDISTSSERFLNDLVEKILGKVQKTQTLRKQSPNVQEQTSSSKPFSWMGDERKEEADNKVEKQASKKDEQETQKEEKRPRSGSKG
jgi:hypothetical protein